MGVRRASGREQLSVLMAPGLILRPRVCKAVAPSAGEQDTKVQDGSPTDASNPQEAIADGRAGQTIVWTNVLLIGGLHLWSVYLSRHMPFLKWQSWVFYWITFIWTGIGVTGGAHRLWTHRSYKADLPLKINLMLAYASSGMNDIFEWVRDHRVHHKFTDTDADPHNATRGFFFSHVGWLFVKKHPEVIRRGKEINMDDIRNDPICRFERKYHAPLAIVLCFVLPAVLPVLLWGETWTNGLALCVVRWVMGMNVIWSVNSVAHLFGGKPFNKNIMPSNNSFVSFSAMGEGWHNYHHVFPWDYKTSENGYLNITMHFIRFHHFLGLAHDLKAASPELIKRIALKYGDGTHPDWAVSAPEVPEEFENDISLVETLPEPKFNKHID